MTASTTTNLAGRVGAWSAHDNIIAGIAHKDVGQIIADQAVVSRATDDVLHVVGVLPESELR